MREEIANRVLPIFDAGLRLQERLDRGESPSLEAEQVSLLGLLLGEGHAPTRSDADFDGDAAGDATRTDAENGRPGESFLGARYAVVCWLDEVFVLDSPWSERWNEHKLEVRLYATNDRAWRFWDQARLAAARPGVDALEVFYLCVMLGFSGELSDNPARLSDWITATREQLVRARAREWRLPPELEPVTCVPPLRGRRALQRMLLAVSATLLVVIPVVAFYLAYRIG
jgi:type VI secretion system protein ImpK